MADVFLDGKQSGPPMDGQNTKRVKSALPAFLGIRNHD